MKGTLFSIAVWAYWGGCLILYLVAIAGVRLVTFPFDRYGNIPNRMVGSLARTMFRAIPGWNVEIHGADPHKIARPTIAVANHQSFLDLPLAYFLPWQMKWVAKKSLFYIPVLGWIIRMTGHISIERSSKSAVHRLQKLIDPVEEGTPAMIFPEGTRTGDGELLPFKNGAFKLAAKYNLQLLPIVLEGGYSAMPRGSWRLSLHQAFHISVLEPLDPADYPDAGALKEECYTRVQNELHRLRNLNT